MRSVDLFCGCGGMSLGFTNAGIEIVGAYDKWPAAAAIYRENFDHPICETDLYRDEVLEQIEDLAPEMIIGGPPCQDFSIAGSRRRGERANLTIRFAEIVAAVRPEWFVMENVYNIERMDVLPEALAIFKEAGYGLTRRVLDASRCGVPQKRRRFILIGHLGDTDGFLGSLIDSRLSEKQMTVREYLGESFGTEYYYMHPRSYNRRAVFSIDEPAATIRGVNRPIPPAYKRHRADKADISEGVRALTTRERSLIQTFPEDFKLVGTKTAVEQAIGNAVPVKLAEFIARCIMDFSNGDS